MLPGGDTAAIVHFHKGLDMDGMPTANRNAVRS